MKLGLGAAVVGAVLIAGSTSCTGHRPVAQPAPSSAPVLQLTGVTAIRWRLRSIFTNGRLTTMPATVAAWIQFAPKSLLASDGLNAIQADLRPVTRSSFTCVNGLTGGVGSNDDDRQSPLNVARSTMELVIGGDVVTLAVGKDLIMTVQSRTMTFVDGGPSHTG